MSDANPAAVGEWAVWSSMTRLFAAAVAVNFAWEMAQMSLYASTGSWLQDSVGCLTASLGDGGMVLMIWATGALVFRRLDWFRRPSVSGYAVMLTMGVILAVAFEMSALRSGRWAYGPSMPRLPMAGLGLLPMLQMMILPPIIFKVVAALERCTLREAPPRATTRLDSMSPLSVSGPLQPRDHARDRATRSGR